MTDTPTIRAAREEDIPGLTRTLGLALFDDPAAAWACRSESLRPAVLASMHQARLRQLLRHRQVWTTADLSSVALWAPPGKWHTSLLQNASFARQMLDPRLLVRVPMLAVGLSRIHRRHPKHPRHWYLSLLGTDPAAQRRGLGSAVLKPVLQLCDEEGHGAYLESANPTNLDFYKHHGFRVRDEIRVPRGPVFWTLWREPRSVSIKSAISHETAALSLSIAERETFSEA